MPREYKRADRVADFIRRELAVLLRREMRDPRVERANISDVVISRDMSLAKVYVSFLDIDMSSGEGIKSGLSQENDQVKGKEKEKEKENLNQENIAVHKQAVEALNNASGFLRSELAKHSTMRSTPKLRFYVDETMRTGEQLDQLIAQAISSHGSSESD